MGTYVGLDIGTKTITGAVMAGTPKKFTLVDVFVEEIPPGVTLTGAPPSAENVDLESGPAPTLGEFIKSTLAERGLLGSDVIASIEAKDCVVRDNIPLPYTREDQIEKTIAFEAENHLITYDVEEMILEYHKVGEQNGNSILILLAVKNDVVAGRLELLKEGGVDPVSLDLDAAALFNAYALTPTFDESRTTLFIDIGATTTKVLLIENGTLVKIRSLRLGAFLEDHNPRQIAEPGVSGGESESSFELPEASSIEARFDEIENALRRLEPLSMDPLGQTLGTDDDEPIAILSDDEYDRVTQGEAALVAEAAAELPVPDRAVPDRAVATQEAGPPASQYDYQEFLRRLGFEIQRTFSTSLIQSPVELICLTGGMSENEEARRYFSENFDVETIFLDFGDSFDMDLDAARREDLNRVGAVAVGLAAKELGHDRLGLDFRKGQFRYEKRFEKLKFPLLTLSVVLCALFLWTTFDYFGLYMKLDNEKTTIFREEAKYYKAFFGEDIANRSKVRLLHGDDVRKKGNEWKGLLGTGDEVPQYVPQVDAVADIANVFRQARKKGINYKIDRMDLKFMLPKRKRSKGLGTKRRGPESQIVYIADGHGTGNEIKQLFKTHSKLFGASDSESSVGRGTEKYRVTLKITPRSSGGR